MALTTLLTGRWPLAHADPPSPSRGSSTSAAEAAGDPQRVRLEHNLDLGRSWLAKQLGLALGGKLRVELSLAHPNGRPNRGHGRLLVRCTACTFGGNRIALPAGSLLGTIRLPRVRLGTIEAETRIQRGRAAFERITIHSPDLQGTVRLKLRLRRPWLASRIIAEARLRLTAAARQRLPTLAALETLLRSAGGGGDDLVLRANGTLRRLRIYPTGLPPRRTTRPAKPTTRPRQTGPQRNHGSRTGPAGAKLARLVRRKGPGSYSIPRSAVDRLLTEPNAMARMARVVPAVRQGQTIGFKLYGMRKASVLHALGLRNGDTVTAINGQPITGPAQALAVYSSVRGASKLVLELRRRGKPHRITIHIR